MLRWPRRVGSPWQLESKVGVSSSTCLPGSLATCFQTKTPVWAWALRSSKALSLSCPKPFSVMRGNRNIHRVVLGMGVLRKDPGGHFLLLGEEAIPRGPAQLEKRACPSEVRGQTFLGKARVQPNFEDCSFSYPGGSVWCLSVDVMASQGADELLQEEHPPSPAAGLNNS